jgi:hypothetical protein
VHLQTVRVLPDVQVHAVWNDVWPLRELALKSLEEAKSLGIEKSLDAGLVVPDPTGDLAALGDDLRDLLEVSRLAFGGDAIVVEDLRDAALCERSRRRDATTCERDNGFVLSDRDWAVVGAVSQ